MLCVGTGATLPTASMKVPPKRKGNDKAALGCGAAVVASMKVPPKRKGNGGDAGAGDTYPWASMKVPPKRKGNTEKLAAISSTL